MDTRLARLSCTEVVEEAKKTLLGYKTNKQTEGQTELEESMTALEEPTPGPMGVRVCSRGSCRSCVYPFPR